MCCTHTTTKLSVLQVFLAASHLLPHPISNLSRVQVLCAAYDAHKQVDFIHAPTHTTTSPLPAFLWQAIIAPDQTSSPCSHVQVLCTSNDAHTQVDPIVPPEGVPNGERITFEG